MDYAQAKAALLDKPEVIEDYPFGPDTVIFKIYSKMFATLSTRDNVSSINLKCDPDEALALRDIFEGVIPGYHMNKKHWNTVLLDQTVPEGEILRMIDNSYSLVINKLTKADRLKLELAHGSENLYK